jgi:hypothetical protein
VVRGARDFVASEIKRYQVKIDIRSVPDEDAMMMGDLQVMQQIFLNLLLHILKPKNREPYTIDISLTTDDSMVEVSLSRETPQNTLSQSNGYFREELLVEDDNGENFLDMALRAHGGGLNVDTRDNRQIYTIRLPVSG